LRSAERAPRPAIGTPESTAVIFVSSMLPAPLGAPSPSEELARRLAAAGRIVLTVSHRTGRAARFIDILLSIWRWRRRYRAACVSVFSGLAFRWAEAACLLLRRLGKPVVLVLHGGKLPEFARDRPGRVRRLLDSAAAVTAPSRFLLDGLRPYRSDLQLVPNALEVSDFPFRVREHPAPHLIWVRAFHAVYNPTLAPRVIAALVRDFPGIRLTMLGRDKDGSRGEVRRVAAELGVADRIDLPGAVLYTEIPAWLERADVFLNTTDVDNTPVSVLEAQASGLCVVSTNVGGLPYLLEDGKDALLVPPNDPDAMAGAVRRVLSEPGLAALLSRHARLKAEGFDWSQILPVWERLLDAVESGRAP
jgi:glycosyltransferase involved in cell wall biosynthesis